MEGQKYTQKDKTKFRATRRWQNFRKDMYSRANGKDAITGKPLRKGHWNLHHLDLDSANYEVLDEDRFLCLNNQTHDFLHWAYRYYRTDKDKFLDRFENALYRMADIEDGGISIKENLPSR